MKTVTILAGAALGVAALGVASRRLAMHQALLPAVASRINTRVIRINQDRSMPTTSITGSIPEPQGDELP